jgi:hypothetical protein
MKPVGIPQVRAEPESSSELHSALLPVESLTDFAARCDASLAAFERTGVSLPADVVLAKLEARLAARLKQLLG